MPREIVIAVRRTDPSSVHFLQQGSDELPMADLPEGFQGRRKEVSEDYASRPRASTKYWIV
jgi:hypothetical protein